jgi:signal transduction histidine kinase
LPNARDRAAAAAEIARLYSLEYGNSLKIAVRIAGVTAGSTLLYLHTGWESSFIWLAGYLVAHNIYFFYLRFNTDGASWKHANIAGGLFLALVLSFIWMPAFLICESDRALSVPGAAMFGCLLVFLVRRGDETAVLMYGEIAIIAMAILFVFGTITPAFGEPTAQIGVAVSGAALLYYFAEATSTARSLKAAASDATRRALHAEKMAAVGRLAGGIAHDFNNNLTAILGHLELLKLIDDPQEREESLTASYVAAKQASETVKRLLAFSRRDKLVISKVQVEVLLAKLELLFKRFVPANVAVRVSDRSPSASFLADEAQLLAALLNLFSNAVDALPKGGEIRIGAEEVRVRSSVPLADGTSLERGNFVCFSVSDTGTGIPADLISRVIEPYFTTKAVGKGTGLGLSMVLGLAKELGGGLRLETSARGTTVIVYLPA